MKIEDYNPKFFYYILFNKLIGGVNRIAKKWFEFEYKFQFNFSKNDVNQTFQEIESNSEKLNYKRKNLIIKINTYCNDLKEKIEEINKKKKNLLFLENLGKNVNLNITSKNINTDLNNLENFVISGLTNITRKTYVYKSKLTQNKYNLEWKIKLLEKQKRKIETFKSIFFLDKLPQIKENNITILEKEYDSENYYQKFLDKIQNWFNQVNDLFEQDPSKKSLSSLKLCWKELKEQNIFPIKVNYENLNTTNFDKNSEKRLEKELIKLRFESEFLTDYKIINSTTQIQKEILSYSEYQTFFDKMNFEIYDDYDYELYSKLLHSENWKDEMLKDIELMYSHAKEKQKINDLRIKYAEDIKKNEDLLRRFKIYIANLLLTIETPEDLKLNLIKLDESIIEDNELVVDEMIKDYEYNLEYLVVQKETFLDFISVNFLRGSFEDFFYNSAKLMVLFEKIYDSTNYNSFKKENLNNRSMEDIYNEIISSLQNKKNAISVFVKEKIESFTTKSPNFELEYKSPIERINKLIRFSSSFTKLFKDFLSFYEKKFQEEIEIDNNYFSKFKQVMENRIEMGVNEFMKLMDVFFKPDKAKEVLNKLNQILSQKTKRNYNLKERNSQILKTRISMSFRFEENLEEKLIKGKKLSLIDLFKILTISYFSGMPSYFCWKETVEERVLKMKERQGFSSRNRRIIGPILFQTCAENNQVLFADACFGQCFEEQNDCDDLFCSKTECSNYIDYKLKSNYILDKPFIDVFCTDPVTKFSINCFQNCRDINYENCSDRTCALTQDLCSSNVIKLEKKFVYAFTNFMGYIESIKDGQYFAWTDDQKTYDETINILEEFYFENKETIDMFEEYSEKSNLIFKLKSHVIGVLKSIGATYFDESHIVFLIRNFTSKFFKQDSSIRKNLFNEIRLLKKSYLVRDYQVDLKDIERNSTFGK